MVSKIDFFLLHGIPELDFMEKFGAELRWWNLKQLRNEYLCNLWTGFDKLTPERCHQREMMSCWRLAIVPEIWISDVGLQQGASFWETGIARHHIIRRQRVCGADTISRVSSTWKARNWWSFGTIRLDVLEWEKLKIIMGQRICLKDVQWRHQAITLIFTRPFVTAPAV